jgi:hypothetical protein
LVEGRLEKPSAYYILRRSSLDYDWARLDAKFSPLVLESVQDPCSNLFLARFTKGRLGQFHQASEG